MNLSTISLADVCVCVCVLDIIIISSLLLYSRLLTSFLCVSIPLYPPISFMQYPSSDIKLPEYIILCCNKPVLTQVHLENGR